MSLEDIGIGFGPQEISFHILFKLEKKKKKKKKFKERTWIKISQDQSQIFFLKFKVIIIVQFVLLTENLKSQ